MNQIMVSNIGVKRDEHGRYCLNDLHRAAGNENRHRPSLWLKNMQTMALFEKIEKAA